MQINYLDISKTELTLFQKHLVTRIPNINPMQDSKYGLIM